MAMKIEGKIREEIFSALDELLEKKGIEAFQTALEAAKKNAVKSPSQRYHFDIWYASRIRFECDEYFVESDRANGLRPILMDRELRDSINDSHIETVVKAWLKSRNIPDMA
jgi:hypothetical protein